MPFGGGHRSVADAVGHALARHTGDRSTVQVIDGLDAVSRRLPLSRLGARLYFWLTSPRVRFLYKRLFKAVDLWPEEFGRACYLLFGRRVRRWLDTEKPDIAVSTFTFVTYVLGAAIHDLRMKTRLVCIVTDGGRVNRSWFHGGADLTVVTDPDTLRTHRSISLASTVTYLPLPLRPGFPSSMSQDEARQALDIPDGLTVLIWAGGQGMGHYMTALARELHRRNAPDMNSIFLTGDNHRLGAELRRMLRDRRATVLGHRDDVPLLLSAVDVVIGKPGWVSLAEATASGLHTICVDTLPGQELENLRVSTARGVASWIPNVCDALEATLQARLKRGCRQGCRQAVPTANSAELCRRILGDAALTQPTRTTLTHSI